MKLNNQIYYWAHMLDESKHASYYDVYMLEHPEDNIEKLLPSLLDEFAKCLHKNHIDVNVFLKDNNWYNHDLIEQL